MTGQLPSAEVFIATSLDGFIARADGDIEWLVGRPTPEGEDFGYAAFIAGIGAIVMGRQSFDKVSGFPEWPYPVPVVVMSRSPDAVKVPEALRNKVRVTSATPLNLLRELDQQGVRRVYVDGGQVVRAFLDNGLIRRIIVTLIPVLLGQGRPLWGHDAREVELDLVKVQHFSNGFVGIEYRA
ncbi:dihydrofolate reductase family protein [Natronohydrobacter thiooxidans]|uniref:dihydrofolate reductase family protein n=1 Tax=Natronohydrobacter thiooxidans TaxID=87172 RepID=UPI0008FF1F5E|nr:dihydrofolate reductase family protein [Natronohydrobacter thiooxidans]